ncbi:MAG: HAMP domain-containing protein [Burkholderiales bacterium]|nr:HAMP domain-containing protein [Burkholderiales bacterium]
MLITKPPSGRLGALWLRLHSLRVVIALTVVVGVVLASFFSYVEQISDLRERHIAQIHTEMDRLGALTALALREPLWQFEVEQANSIMEAAFINPDVVSIAIWDDKGTPFASRARSPEDPTLVERASRVVERNKTMVGRLELQMSTAGYVRKVSEVRLLHVHHGLQISIGALLVILLLLHWRLVRPLEDLVAASGRLEKGQLDVPIRRVFRDEVGSLADGLEATRLALIHLIAQLESRNQELTDANEHLEQRVAERTESLELTLLTLERAQEEIVQTEKLASLGRVVAGVAHELNTPIGNALTVASTIQAEVEELKVAFAASTLRRSALTAFFGRADEGLALSLSNLQRAAHLISDFKQVAVDQTSDQRREFDLAEVSREILNMLQPTLRKSGCEVQKFLCPDLVCDSFPGRYGQVLTNLVVNAVTHGFEPGTTGRITVSIGAVDAQTAELVVSDNGVGMEDAVRARIFDPFFTTKMGRGGTGLGMNIVHGIVTRVLGGQITVHSAPGEGTRIRVVFPRVAATVA